MPYNKGRLFSLVFTVFPLAAVAGVDGDACHRAWRNDQSDLLRCTITFDPTSKEREQLRAETSGVIQNLSCAVPISVSKGDVFEDLLNSRTVRLGEHRIKCRMDTNRDPVDVELTVAPSFRIAGDRVTEAAVNLTTVRGVPLFMARLLREHVNESAEIAQSLKDSLQALLDEL